MVRSDSNDVGSDTNKNEMTLLIIIFCSIFHVFILFFLLSHQEHLRKLEQR